MKIYTSSKETGMRICECNTLEDARALIELYEADDRLNNCYEPNFYDIVDEDYNSLIY